jgi:hypothetical protein
MDILGIKSHPDRMTVFASAWVHTVTQVALAFLFLGKQALLLPILLASVPGIFYLPFQFPITGLLLVGVHIWAQKRAGNQGVGTRILLTGISFVGLATLVVGAIVFLSGIWRASQMPNLAMQDVANNTTLVMGYCIPVFMLGELFRQTLFLKKIYAESNNRK